MSSNPTPIEITDEITKRNYKLIRQYGILLLDEGLNFLRGEYIKENSESSFLEFTAINYFDYIMKDYIRRKGKSQIRIVLNSSVTALDKYDYTNDMVNSDHLDDIVKSTYHEYADVDMSLKHSSQHHPIRNELELISRLTYRILIIQVTRLLSCRCENIHSFSDLVRAKYPEKELCQESTNAIFSIFDQMIDCFERNLDAINIPFYKPTWNIRDWKYMRRIYEFALQVSDEHIEKIYTGGQL